MDIQDFLLFKDDHLLAVNKPAGLRTIQDGYDPNLPHLAGFLASTFGQVWVVHRLDRDTSGVILFARSPQAHRALNNQFERREIKKEYHAIVVGPAEFQTRTAALPLRVDGDHRHRTVIDPQTGKLAETYLAVIEHFSLLTLLKAFPHSGYTHQIRAHLAAIGLPILRDPLYHSLLPETELSKHARTFAAALPIERCALHAFQITFIHPMAKQPMIITAPYPIDFSDTLTVLRSQIMNER